MLQKLTFLITALILLCCTNTKATHLSGAEFTYYHLSGNDYVVSLHLYRDCNGISVPSTLGVNVESVNCGMSFTGTLTKVGPPTIVTTLPGSQTTCQGGSIQGYEHYIYRETVTMPAQCTDWLFSFEICCRNNAITNLDNPGSRSAYVSSTLNNTVSNTSPVYFIEPVFYGSIGNNFTAALGGFDADGDQLVFSLAAPLEGAGLAIPFVPGLSVAQPLEIMAGTSVSFSPTTGLFQCVLNNTNQIVTFDVLVEEHRGGQIIAVHRRTIQLLPLNLPGQTLLPPATSGISGATMLDDYTIEYTDGQPLSFRMLFNDPDSGDVVTYNSAYSSIMTQFPNAQVTTSNPNNNSNELQVDVTIPAPKTEIITILLEENNFLQHSYSYELRSASATNVSTIEDKKQLTVYPNPMEKTSTFELLEGNYNQLSLEVFDMMGRSIYSQNGKTSTQIVFDRKDIPAGVYLYQIKGDGQLIQADLLQIK